jgi:hypothetical protein
MIFVATRKALHLIEGDPDMLKLYRSDRIRIHNTDSEFIVTYRYMICYVKLCNKVYQLSHFYCTNY